MKLKTMMAGVFALTWALAPQAALAQGEVHAIDVRLNGRLLKFPANAPVENQVGVMVGMAPRTIFAMDFNADGSILYAIDFSGLNPPVADCRLGTFDFATGMFTSIAQVSGAAAAVTNFTGMSFDRTNNTMYTTNGTSLYTIDLATANTTLVGAISGIGTPLIIDLCVDNNGVMYAHDIALDQIVTINKATGAATVLGPTGLAGNFAQGMDVDPSTNIIYAHIYVGGGVAHWCSINPTSGAPTIILTTTAWNSELEFAIKGAAVVCYPDCDGSGTLTIADFGCFQTKFVQNDPYADCDGNGSLTIADFGCFQTKFVQGCP